MDILKTQNKLLAAGFSPGPIDGDLGPKTFTALLNYAAGKTVGSLTVLLGRSMAVEFPKYEIVTDKRISYFIAQACIETGYFKYMSEVGSGKDANHDKYDDYLQKYDFRKDLGNSHVGDGDRYRGRGLFQITGIFNYTLYGTRLGINLLANPEKVCDPEIATQTACLFWSSKKLNALADKDDYVGVTKKINGGRNALEERLKVTSKMISIFH